jgi:hypothetical protein
VVRVGYQCRIARSPEAAPLGPLVNLPKRDLAQLTAAILAVVAIAFLVVGIIFSLEPAGSLLVWRGGHEAIW